MTHPVPDPIADRMIWSNARVSVDFLAQIIDHLGQSVFVKDKRFRFVLVNRAFCDLVGHPAEKLLGHTDYDFFRQNEADFFRQKDIELFSTGNTMVIEEAVTDSSGRRHLISTTKAALRNPDGKATHVVGMIHDITSIKAAEEALRLNNEELEQRVQERTAALQSAQSHLVRAERLAVLGRLSGGLAHQIRNPLSAIKNAAYVLANLLGHVQKPDISNALAVIHDEIQRANQFITDLLDYARVRPAVRRATSVEDLVTEAVRDAKLSSMVNVVKHLGGLPRVSIDRPQVQSALVNLIRNASEAMRGVGTVVITGHRDRESVKIAIEDTGTGLSEEVKNRLFEPLVTDKAQGTGLGLATALALIENQGGGIELERTSSRGTRFAVRLPVAPER